MTYENRLLKKFNLSGKAGAKKKADLDSPVVNMMNDPAYLRQSSALINEALQKGFDVLQLASGDIVTTGTKTVVYQYTWDSEKCKLVKTKTADSGIAKKAKRSALAEEEDEEEAETEGEEA
jgi:Protein of unknown function (DUF2671)